MRLTVDIREPRELTDALKNFVDTINSGKETIFFDIKQLDIGDAIIYFDETDLLNPNKQIIFERKSLGDLIASIKDGRYKEQSFRLDQYPVHNHNIYYIIEGDIDKFVKNPRNSKVPSIKQTIYSTIFTISYYKGFSLIVSKDIEETATYIFRFLDKLSREKERSAYYNLVVPEQIEPSKSEEIELTISGENENISHKYSDCIKSSKKSNITIDNILEIMLLQIPGVCPAAAQVIASHFGTIKNLVNNLENNPECLNCIFIKQKKIRKISKIAKQNIFKYLLHEDEKINVNI